MSPRFPTLAALLLSTAALHAEETAPATTAAPAPYQLQRKSAFTATGDEVRAPFWPIGWAKRKAGPAAPEVVAQPTVTLDEKAFKVTSILLGNPSLAIINGRTYSEGEFLRQPRAAGGVPTVATTGGIPAGVRVRVYRIEDGVVTFQCQEQLLPVALQRPELATRNGEEELLLEDRP